ncbi:phosphoglucosamine mutase [Candidatus Neomarinimicrobiota bacterium]
MALIRTISGVRGIVGEDLTLEAVYQHAAAFARLQPPGPILLARDSRPHGQMLMAVASAALKAQRRRIIVADIVPTPTAQFLVPSRGLAGAMVLTASHNPVEYNGMKFIDADGLFLGGTRTEILFSRADQEQVPEKIDTKHVHGSDLPDAAGYHIRDVMDLSCIDVEAILRRRFKVVVDTVNGAAHFALPTLLEAFGCEVVRIHCESNGIFPRGTEPIPEHLTDLGTAVVEHGAQLGLATDPDADRLALVDELGQPLGEEYTLVLAVDAFLRRTGSRKPVTTNLSSTMILDEVARRYGLEVERSAVGEINVVNLMQANGGAIGGEGNGGVILAESHLGRDSLVGAALILERLVQEEATVSQIKKALPEYHIIKHKVSLAGLDPEVAIRQIAGEYQGVEQNDVDGLKLIWEDHWIHIRKSNTEPIIRIIAEAPTPDQGQELISQIASLVTGQ